MNTRVVDVVNFNADASCLSSKSWLYFLEGGARSKFYQWLSLYPEYQKKVVLGFPGATIADIQAFNPEAIDLINSRPDIFEIIIRPFAHDISLLRSQQGFTYNVALGKHVVENTFSNICNYYLPPEFMCNSRHISSLKDMGIEGVFINSGRYDQEVSERIPGKPYEIAGLMDDTLTCLPFNPQLTAAYLHGIHHYSATNWNLLFQEPCHAESFSWRDGESAFLLPDSVKREEQWLAGESSDVERIFLSEKHAVNKPTTFENVQFHSYPIHSFSAWVKEMKMYWFIEKVQRIEEEFDNLDCLQKHIWLQLISSDILSSVEKSSPVIKITSLSESDSGKTQSYTIYRKEKGYEGEELLNIFENLNTETIQKYLENSEKPHIRKLRSRLDFLANYCEKT